ncbi:MAG: exosortase [Gammaproteobacteria bacterium]
MDAVLTGPSSTRHLLHRGWPIVVGLVALYGPTYFDLYETFWKSGRAVQGPVILLWVAWLVWRDRARLAHSEPAAASGPGIALFVIGLICYALGRSQSFFQLEIGSQVPLLLGVAWLFLGREGARGLLFPVAFTLFLVPVPGTMLDQMLLPLKQLVSAIVDNGLHAVGYPIARNGVVLMIGRYDLLIADACSGLNSMVALSGMGLIYTYVVGRNSRTHNTLLLISVLPVAFIANVIRVVGLLLVTYYFGDSAGRTFHSSAAWLEIALAFAGFFGIDSLLSAVDSWRQRSRAKAGSRAAQTAHKHGLGHAL